jgi:hypothetical protein
MKHTGYQRFFKGDENKPYRKYGALMAILFKLLPGKDKKTVKDLRPRKLVKELKRNAKTKRETRKAKRLYCAERGGFR